MGNKLDLRRRPTGLEPGKEGHVRPIQRRKARKFKGGKEARQIGAEINDWEAIDYTVDQGQKVH
jgi:hypothetical protein